LLQSSTTQHTVHSKIALTFSLIFLVAMVSIGNITSNVYAVEPQFDLPFGVEADSSGNVFVADTRNDRIQKFTNTGTFIRKWGSTGFGNGQFSNPGGVAVDSSGNVFVANIFNERIQKFSNTGTFINKWGSEGTGDGQFDNPIDVAVDSSGNVFVADTFNNRIEKFTNKGTFIRKWGTLGAMSINLDAQELNPFS